MNDADLLRCLGELARQCARRPELSALVQGLVRGALRPFEAKASALGTIDEHGLLEIRTMHGFPAGTLQRGPRFPLNDALPLSDVARTGRPLAGTYREMTQRYPALAEYEPRGTHALYLPLRSGDRTLGAISLGMEQPSKLAERSAFWEAVGGMLALALLDAEARSASAGASAPNVAGGQGPGELTARQREILEQVRRGRTNAQIARALQFGTSTIGHDLMRVFDALGVESRTEAVEVAERAGLLAPLDAPTAADEGTREASTT